MNNLVKILSSDDGEKRQEPKWCLVVKWDGSNRTFCEGEAFGFGESGCEFELKVTQRGGITCENCVEMIKKIKAVKL